MRRRGQRHAIRQKLRDQRCAQHPEQTRERDPAGAGPYRRQQGPWQDQQQRQADRDQGNEQDQVQRLGAVSDEELAVALEDVVHRLGDGEGPEREQVRRRQRDLADAGPP